MLALVGQHTKQLPVFGGRQEWRYALCGPCPPDANMPTRPAVPTGVTVVRNGGAAAVTNTSDLNVIPNPSIIPILSPPTLTGPPPGNSAN